MPWPTVPVIYMPAMSDKKSTLCFDGNVTVMIMHLQKSGNYSPQLLVPVDLTGPIPKLKPKTYGRKIFGQNTLDRKLSDCFSATSDKTTFGQKRNLL